MTTKVWEVVVSRIVEIEVRLSVAVDDFDWVTQRQLETELAALDPSHEELKAVPVDEDCEVYLRGILGSATERGRDRADRLWVVRQQVSTA